MKKITVILSISAIVLALFVFVEIYLFLNTAPTDEKIEKIVSIERGWGFRKIARQLKIDGVITHEVKFYFLARWKGGLTKIKAGEYLLATNLKPTEVLSALVLGRTYLHRVTVPEGYNIYQIADLVSSLTLVSKEQFLQTAHDPLLLSQWMLPGPSVEGYLFPESYYFSKPVTAEKIIEMMVQRFRENYTEEIQFHARKLGMTLQEVVTLASIIEKETRAVDERRLVSAVFHNRLKKNMKLQSDPTVIYGIRSFNGNLTRKDLLTPSPYNTYTKYGYPQGPIANPGQASLKAAVSPAPVGYLYFVSKNDGTHVFTKTYQEHLKAVKLYQKSLLRPALP
ncbi:MAG: endolytic transglycosylase MltG [Deltaproteobacteria bacterium]|mgnify:CR=1 FL=1